MLSINVTVTSTLNVSMNDTRPLASAVRVCLVFSFCVCVSVFVGFFCLLFFFSKPVAPVVFQPAKASSDRSECVRVAPDDAFYCNPCLSKSSYNWKLFLRKCWLLQPLAVLNIDFVFNVQVPWPQIYIFFVFVLFLKNHTKNVLTLVTSCCPHFPAMTLSYCKC